LYAARSALVSYSVQQLTYVVPSFGCWIVGHRRCGFA